MLRKPKHSTIEFVAPKEEEEEVVVYISVAEYRAREISHCQGSGVSDTNR